MEHVEVVKDSEKQSEQILYGIWDKQQQKFRDDWEGFKDRTMLESDFTDYIRDTLLLGSCLVDEPMTDEELWAVFDYEIKQYYFEI